MAGTHPSRAAALLWVTGHCEGSGFGFGSLGEPGTWGVVLPGAAPRVVTGGL